MLKLFKRISWSFTQTPFWPIHAPLVWPSFLYFISPYPLRIIWFAHIASLLSLDSDCFPCFVLHEETTYCLCFFILPYLFVHPIFYLLRWWWYWERSIWEACRLSLNKCHQWFMVVEKYSLPFFIRHRWFVLYWNRMPCHRIFTWLLGSFYHRFIFLWT